MAMFQSEERREEESEIIEADTVIGASVKLDGDFFGESDTVIYGKVSGSVVVKGDLTLGDTAEVNANIEADNVSIAGRVHGNVSAGKFLSLASTAHIEGDISTGRIEIAAGAHFNGKCSMTSEKSETEEV